MNAVLRKLLKGANALAVELYRRSNGKIGGKAKGGTPVLLLTVPGRKTGTPHTVSVSYFPHENGYLLVASGGGMKEEPQWMRNLRATSSAHIEIGREHRDVSVRIADPAERDQLWRDVVVARAPGFASYEKKAGNRVIAIAIVTPTAPIN